jgi:MoaA/NifB/PqqE/SkfB family radical SAM enzyme
MISLDSIDWLHVESTTRCNASCPACPRNNYGYGLKDGVTVQDLSLDVFSETIQQLKNLTTIQLCGNLGDPVSAKNINEQIDIIISYKKIKRIQIHTNGSLRSTMWWGELSDRLKCFVQADVVFALDGLDNTHSIYRQGTDYSKIIENATAFIQNGGSAVWQFIPFKHNQHQIIDCMKLSRKLGFKRFEFIRNARYPSQARHYKTGKNIQIEKWSDPKEDKNVFLRQNNTVDKKSCMHLSMPSLYLSAAGVLSPCCFLSKCNIKETDITTELEQKNYRHKCLKNCGTKI